MLAFGLGQMHARGGQRSMKHICIQMDSQNDRKSTTSKSTNHTSNAHHFGACPEIAGTSAQANFLNASPSTLNFVQPFISTAPRER